MNYEKWQKALNEIEEVLESKNLLKEGRYELPFSEVPLYAELRGDYNKEYPFCPVVVHNGKWATDEYCSNDILTVGFLGKL
jgi:hypothetical protein